jgi:hypothetical protein
MEERVPEYLQSQVFPADVVWVRAAANLIGGGVFSASLGLAPQAP